MDKVGIISSRYAVRLPDGTWTRGAHTIHEAQEKAMKVGGMAMEFSGMFWREVVDKRWNSGKEKAKGTAA